MAYQKPVHHGKPKMTRDQTRVRLAMQLYTSTDAAFAKYTVPDLQRTYGNIPIKELTLELATARQKRGLDD